MADSLELSKLALGASIDMSPAHAKGVQDSVAAVRGHKGTMRRMTQKDTSPPRIG